MQRNTMLAAGISSVVLGAIAVVGINLSANAETAVPSLPTYTTSPVSTPTGTPTADPNVTTLPWNATTNMQGDDADDQGENESEDATDVSDSNETAQDATEHATEAAQHAAEKASEAAQHAAEKAAEHSGASHESNND